MDRMDQTIWEYDATYRMRVEEDDDPVFIFPAQYYVSDFGTYSIKLLQAS